MSWKIYTKTGDEGQTGLFGGPRVRKDDPRIEAYGTVDELNAHLGVCRTVAAGTEIDGHLAAMQHDLFALGAELASPEPDRNGTRWVVQPAILRLESLIDRFDAALPPFKQFILPAGTPAAAQLYLARTGCRRAARRLVTLANEPRDPMTAAVAMSVPVESDDEGQQRSVELPQYGGELVSPSLIVYLNRLGDLLFVLARAANALAGLPDEPWQKSAGGGA